MIVLVTGGSASGKSAWAEDAAAGLAQGDDGGLVYLATMDPRGAEARRRIARHLAQRSSKGFRTVEAPTPEALEAVEAQGAVVLLDDVGNLVSNAMFVDLDDPREPDEVASWTARSIASLAGRCAHLVAVADCVGADGCRYDALSQAYIRSVGACCQTLAREADLVVEVVAGLPLAAKGRLDHLRPHAAGHTEKDGAR